MSLKWNFPPFYRYYGLDKLIDPCILHFMSHPKPWNGAFLPWSRSEHQPYLDFVDSNPAIAADLRLFSTGRRVKYLLQQRVKWLDELVHAGRRRSVVDAAVRYEQTVVA
jgi:lipopolysaccharide biosynthesis glycosyltransferase